MYPKFRFIFLPIFLGMILAIVVIKPTQIEPAFAFIYADYPSTSMVVEADLIVAGNIVTVGPTQWNQDDGRPWSGGLPYHQLTIEVDQIVAGKLAANKMAVWVLGPAPQSGTTAADEHMLTAGKSYLFFVRQTEMAWKEDLSRPAFMLLGHPDASSWHADKRGGYLDSDGTRYSVAEIQQLRIPIEKDQ